MSACKISIYLAYGMLIYTISSLFYLLMTRNIGTPFNDSLTKQQIIIKRKSANIRKKIFYMGILFGLFICYIIRPFKTC